MLLKLRQRMASEQGFTLIELLVVMLIIGILAAIAIPTFFNQTKKAGDAGAKEMAHTAQVTMETYATDNNGSYALVTPGKLNTIEKSLSIGATDKPRLSVADPNPVDGSGGWNLTVVASTGTTFSITKDPADGHLSFTCNAPGKGGCPDVGGAGVWSP
jgi:prepilin-type N-terminal cleavage/methylation domain-containing protein